MFGIGGFELLIILIFGFILVGDRLPDVAKTLGRAIRTFQNDQRDMSKVIKEDVFDPNAEEPFKDPLAALDKMGGIAKKTGSSLAEDLNEMAAVAKKKKDASPAVSSPADTHGETSGASESKAETGAHMPDANARQHEDRAADASAKPSREDAPMETFAQRRARYEKERAARLAAQAEQKAAAEAAAAAEAIQAADAAVERTQNAAAAKDPESSSLPQESPQDAPVTNRAEGGE